MPLDEARQALLDVLCHCYGELLEHLDLLDDAVQAHQGWDCYRVVAECVNSATAAFGAVLPRSPDSATLCEDFLRRLKGSLDLHLPRSSPVENAYAELRASILASPIQSPADLTVWQHVGEELSSRCYESLLPTSHPYLTRTVQPVSIVPANRQSLYALPHKTGGESQIVFAFAAHEFTFQDFVNLPLYFFHEYLSHIHSAPLFGEHLSAPKTFEEGWMLFLARQIYSDCLLRNPHPSLTHHLHREHYAERYFQSQTDDISKEPWVRFGIEQARRFENVVGPALFRRATLLAAVSPFNRFSPMIPDLHGEFVKRVKGWLDRTATLSHQERDTRLRRLAALLQEEDALRRLLEFLVEA